MFVNGHAALLVVELLVVGSLLLCLGLMAHCVWLHRLAGSHVLGRLGRTARIALLALAAVTPVVSFYGIGTVIRLRRLARQRGLAGLAWTVLGPLGALAATVFGFLVLTSPHWTGMLLHLPGMLVILAVPCAVLGMACRVLVRSSSARVGWVISTGTAAAGLLLLI